MMIKEDRIRVGSLREGMCVTNGMAIASLVSSNTKVAILTRNCILQTFYAIPNIIASNKCPPLSPRKVMILINAWGLIRILWYLTYVSVTKHLFFFQSNFNVFGTLCYHPQTLGNLKRLNGNSLNIHYHLLVKTTVYTKKQK